jgi:tetratricopeptide (TPR) repeat protein
VAAHSRGLLDEALAHYTKAIELDPTSSLGYMNRGNAKDEKGLWEESIKDFQKALSFAPRRWVFRTQVEESILTHEIKPDFREARGLHRVKKYKEAIEKYLPLVTKFPRTRYGYTARRPPRSTGLKRRSTPGTRNTGTRSATRTWTPCETTSASGSSWTG